MYCVPLPIAFHLPTHVCICSSSCVYLLSLGIFVHSISCTILLYNRSTLPYHYNSIFLMEVMCVTHLFFFHPRIKHSNWCIKDGAEHMCIDSMNGLQLSKKSSLRGEKNTGASYFTLVYICQPLALKLPFSSINPS